MVQTIEVRNNTQFNDAITLAQRIVYKRYFSELKQYSLLAPKEILLEENSENFVWFLQLEELTYKKGEDIFQRLSTVYHASMSLGCNLIVLIDVEKVNAPVKIYIGVRSDSENAFKNDNLRISFETLRSGIISNFPGTKLHKQDDMSKLIDDIFGEHIQCISSVSCVASARDKSKTENKNFIQGLERFIDAMQGNAYTAVFIAQPISSDEQASIRDGYETLYSTLSSFHKSIWSYSENESMAVMESLSEGVSKTVAKGSSHTQAHTTSIGINIGANSSKSTSDAISHTKSKPTNISRGGQAIGGVGDIMSTVGGMVLKEGVPIGGILLGSGILMKGIGSAMQGSSISEGIVNTIGKGFGLSGGFNAGYAKTISDTDSKTKSDTKSTMKTKGTTETKGNGKTFQFENINKQVEEMLKRIEEQLQRVQEGEAYGSYSCAAYFLSGSPDTSLLAANTYRALMIGEGSSVESGAINSWKVSKNSEDLEENKVCLGIKEYLRKFIHPIFTVPVSSTSNEISYIFYTPGTIVSGLELPLHLGFPTKSVYGLPVLEHAEFGRNIMKKTISSMETENKIRIGSIYHMGQVVENIPVELDVQGLTSHTFISGSTGSGKSNAIYQILDKLKKQEIKFLVVEPAKGEYKDIFGGYDDVHVCGTNPLRMPLLQINPFSFPEGIHVLEHIDRLVEIFNACWPMYAAMPAVLKDAIEKSYIRKGWDLNYSICESKEFPTFFDVLDMLPEVMNESLYSSDTKNDYSGALITRVRELTNGINGQVLCSFKDTSTENKDLFDRNVIVDLSRIGSMETKSLIMGILIMKLQEHRMDTGGRNKPLSHVTVIEEAHNLLRRTSTIQSQESSNLQGKSVEMISNAIAEMRTYGEGFMIVDQAPGLLDESVIRNTNTKIIFKMPDEADRILVGKAAALTDNQISELAKLPQGVAAIYQNKWIEPVLCQFPKYSEGKSYEFYEKQDAETLRKQDVIALRNFFGKLFEVYDIGELNKEEVDVVKRWINTFRCSEDTLSLLKKIFDGKKLSKNDKYEVAYNVFNGIQMGKILEDNEDEEKGKEAVCKEIENMYGIKDVKITNIVFNMIYETILQKASDSDFAKRYREFDLTRRIQ